MAKRKCTFSVDQKVLTEFSVWCARKRKKMSHVVEKLLKNFLKKEGIEIK